MDRSPKCLAPTGDWCGEGVVWHPEERAVYWTDINRFLIHRWAAETGSVRSWFFEEPVTTVVPTSLPGVLLVVTGSGAMAWEPEFNTRHPHLFRLPDWPRVRCNDAAADRSGRLWIGSMRNNVHPDGSPGEAGGTDGKLFRIPCGGGEPKVVLEELGISNTVVWSPDGETMYFGDSLRNEIWHFRFDAGVGSLSAQRPFFSGFERGAPDGSAMDEEGCIWNCRFGGHCVVRVTPRGKVDRIVELPVSNPTNCTFGGDDMRTLFITSASLESEPGERLGGSLFAVEADVPGLPDNHFHLEL